MRNMQPHPESDALIDVFYGIAENEAAVRAHISECAECANRWEALRRVRAAAASSAEIPSAILAAQRRKIYERIESPEPNRARVWAPALAAALLAIAGIYVQQAERPKPSGFDANDAQLFADAYSMEQSFEPSAAAPIHALFEEQQ
jgi:anti-sigma factor RsiW